MYCTFGVVAHVDAGKTTFSEQILQQAGVIRKAGRVDSGTAYMDHTEIEAKRGITVFSEQTRLVLHGIPCCLIDTPGHADFTAEMARNLAALDLAILLVSASEGIQGQTISIWQLLRQLHIPTVLFMNKADLQTANAAAVLSDLKKQFGNTVLDCSALQYDQPNDTLWEEVAELDDTVFEKFCNGDFKQDVLLSAIKKQFATCQLYPCFYGSALQNQGITSFLRLFAYLCQLPPWNDKDTCSGLVYKVRNDARLGRLHFVKLTQGTLSVKDEINGNKVNQIFIPKGGKYEPTSRMCAGETAAISFHTPVTCGTCFGDYHSASVSHTAAALQTRILYPETVSSTQMEQILQDLEAEEPSLQIARVNGNFHISVMGYVQLEVLQDLIQQRYHIPVTFGKCHVLYLETIQSPVMGYGHFEPLRHYAEVHVLLSPNHGQGIQFENRVHSDVLHQSYIHLIETHVKEKVHIGMLTGSPLTDVTITLIAGRAHIKHTEGGDFREATYRAIRQGLEKAQMLLLEPFYRFTIAIQPAFVGRVLTDITKFGGTFEEPQTHGALTTITGKAPVSEMLEYPMTIASLSSGRGSVSLNLDGYYPCHNTETVVNQIGYDKTRDIENPSCSVFCAKGAGFTVPWDQAEAMMHIKD